MIRNFALVCIMLLKNLAVVTAYSPVNFVQDYVLPDPSGFLPVTEQPSQLNSNDLEKVQRPVSFIFMSNEIQDTAFIQQYPSNADDSVLDQIFYSENQEIDPQQNFTSEPETEQSEIFQGNLWEIF